MRLASPLRFAAIFAGLAVLQTAAAFAPEHFASGKVARREVEWFRHTGEVSWGDGDTSFIDRFSVAKPVEGDAYGRPLLVVLHWRGSGWPGKGVDMQTRLADDKDGVFSAPDDFYILILDDIRNYHVLFNRRHEQYWWGATSAYGGPTVEDVPRLRNRVTSCEHRVMASIEWTVGHYGIDRNRIYLCGNSMGGQAAYAIGLAHGEVFAAVNANVPATVWYAAARLGFVDDSGQDIIDWNVSRFAEPPVCVEWSGVDDIWSRNREVIVRNLRKRKWPHMVFWGDFGHCGSISAARRKNDLIERFDWLSVRRNEAYPVFNAASCDDTLPWPFKVWRPKYGRLCAWKGDIYSAEMKIAANAPKVGQINGFFRWRNLQDDETGWAMELHIAGAEELSTRHFSPPLAAIADVTIRRIQARNLANARRAVWKFGAQSGIAERDAHGALTIPDLGLRRTPEVLELRPLAGGRDILVKYSANIPKYKDI